MDNTVWQEAIKEHLVKLDSALKQTTVIAYIEQKIKGQPYDTKSFWERPDTCARSTWNKWKRDDPAFSSTLQATWSTAADFRANGAAEAISEAVLLLQLNTPDFARTIIDLATNGHTKDETALRAALAGLDRASEMTAAKSEVYMPELDDALELIWGSNKEDAESDDNSPD